MKVKAQDATGTARATPRKSAALILGGLAMGVFMMGGSIAQGAGGSPAAAKNAQPYDPSNFWPSRYKADQYSYFNNLHRFKPGTPLDANEMRITFLGSVIPAPRRAQQEMSVFVEVGWVQDATDPTKGKALDQFVFDCGSGVSANYAAMNIGFDRMDKVFLCHLHGDHMNDLSHIYTFGPSAGRYSPLYVWGPSASDLQWTEPSDLNPSPKTYGKYDDGLNTYCQMLRAAMRWHSESFSFQNTNYASYKAPKQADWGLPCAPVPVQDPRALYDARYNEDDYLDSPTDGYALIPLELGWTKKGDLDPATGLPDNIAYWNQKTGVKITHFPVIHCRKASIGYRLEWKNPNDPNAPVRTMIYTSDTRPEQNSIDQASNGGLGVDVFIHEMVVPPEVWAFKSLGLRAPPPEKSKVYDEFVTATNQTAMIQSSSHTPQGAFGYLLGQISPWPRLTVATHFPVADDTVECAYRSVLKQCPKIGKRGERITWSFDLMVIRVTGSKIYQLQGVVSDFSWTPNFTVPGDLNPPKYWKYLTDTTGNIQYDNQGNPIKVGDPLAQIDWQDVIPATEPDGTVNYRDDGY